MAAGTPDREAKKRLPGGADDIVQLVIAIGRRIGRFIIPVPEAEETGGDVR